MSKIIAVHSYRGGTGKSNITANLAVAAAQQGYRVGVIDTDLQSPGIHVLFGLNETVIDKTLNDFLWRRSALMDAAYEVSPPLNTEGALFLVPSSVDPDAIARILSEGYDVSMLNDGCRQLVKLLNLDYLFIDTHPGLNKESFLSIAIADLLLLVLRPDHQDFQGTAVTVDIAKQLKARQTMLIANKVISRLNAKKLRSYLEQTYELPVAGLLPLCAEMMLLGSGGLFCVEHPDHPLTQKFVQVLQEILLRFEF